MKVLILTVALALIAASVGAQPADGDVVLSVETVLPWNWSSNLVSLDLAKPGVLHTIMVARMSSMSGAPDLLDGVQMAANNHDLMVNMHLVPPGCSMIRVAPTGSFSTVVVLPVGTRGQALDHDGCWILPSPSHLLASPCLLLSYNTATRAITTLISLPFATAHQFRHIVIDREPGAPPYVIGCLDPSHFPDKPGPLLRTDRTTIRSTIKSVYSGTRFDLDPATGDLIFALPGNVNGGLQRMGRSGSVTTIYPAMWHNLLGCVRVTQDGCALAPALSPLRKQWELLKIDLRSGALVTFAAITATPNTRIHDIEVYGRRRLCCTGSGRPGTTVSISLSSRRAADANRSYALACSFNRRRGMFMPNGEWLYLDTTDPLFQLTSNSPPAGIFGRFRGQTDNRGTALAQVHLPAALPSGLGITVFVAGVIYDAGGVRSVTNTHWFVLN